MDAHVRFAYLVDEVAGRDRCKRVDAATYCRCQRRNLIGETRNGRVVKGPVDDEMMRVDLHEGVDERLGAFQQAAGLLSKHLHSAKISSDAGKVLPESPERSAGRIGGILNILARCRVCRRSGGRVAARVCGGNSRELGFCVVEGVFGAHCTLIEGDACDSGGDEDSKNK